MFARVSLASHQSQLLVSSHSGASLGEEQPKLDLQMRTGVVPTFGWRWETVLLYELKTQRTGS